MATTSKFLVPDEAVILDLKKIEKLLRRGIQSYVEEVERKDEKAAVQTQLLNSGIGLTSRLVDDLDSAGLLVPGEYKTVVETIITVKAGQGLTVAGNQLWNHGSDRYLTLHHPAAVGGVDIIVNAYFSKIPDSSCPRGPRDAADTLSNQEDAAAAAAAASVDLYSDL